MSLEMTVDNSTPTNITFETNDHSDREARAAAFRKELESLNNMSGENEVQQDIEIKADEAFDNESDRADDDSSDSSVADQPDSVETESESNSLDNKLIPKKRLDQEIKKRAELEAKLQAERDARIKFETELSMYNNALEKLNKNQVEKQNETPAFEPLDDEAHKFYLKKLQEIENKFEEKAKTLTYEQTQARFEQVVNNQALEFSKKHSDFEDAYKYVVDAEINKAKLLGFDDSKAQEIAMENLKPIAWRVYNNGGDVASTVYNIAKTYGYNPKTESKPGVNLKKIESNMRKSQSIIDDVPSASVNVSADSSANLNIETFNRNLTNADGRGVDKDKFRQLLNKMNKGM